MYAEKIIQHQQQQKSDQRPTYLTEQEKPKGKEQKKKQGKLLQGTFLNGTHLATV